MLLSTSLARRAFTAPFAGQGSRPASALRAAMATSSAPQAAEPEVLEVEVSSNMRAAVLNRPAALNALNANQVSLLSKILSRWDQSDVVHGVLLKGSGGKAFCSGGDVKAAVLSCRSGSIDAAAAFFKAEYALDYQISRMRKPVVAIVDGLCFGGGAGLAMNSSIRVVTERALFAMPESAIGFFPDVGASYWLGRLPGHMGAALALTGWRLTGREMYDLRLATHFVPSAQLESLDMAMERLGASAVNSEAISTTIESHNMGATTSPLPEESIVRHYELVDDCFGKQSVEEIDAALAEAAGRLGAEAPAGRLCAALLAELRKGSPTTLKVGLQMFRAHKGKPLREVLAADQRVAVRMLRGKDFHEGVRAMLIDKTKDAKWSPVALKDVSAAAVAAYLEPLPPAEELQLPREDGRASVPTARGSARL